MLNRSNQKKRRRDWIPIIFGIVAMSLVILAIAIGMHRIQAWRDKKGMGSEEPEIIQAVTEQQEASEPAASESETDSEKESEQESEKETESEAKAEISSEKAESSEKAGSSEKAESSEKTGTSSDKEVKPADQTPSGNTREPVTIEWNSNWKYADFSKVHSSPVKLYYAQGSNRKNVVVGINPGHGSQAAQNVKTQCHPDGSPKITGGTTSAGATTAIGASAGMDFIDGTSEAKVNLRLALKCKDALLAAGYDVLMIREDSDVNLDNVARSVYANNNADCHLALHFDSGSSDKGFFYLGVPDNSSYRSMEPVASVWKEDNRLGESILQGMRDHGMKIFSSGSMEMDLTQTAYSSVPSVDLEMGDQATDHSDSALEKMAQAIVTGLDYFFE